MELFDESKFKTKKELFTFLVKNKEKLIAQKKSVMKKSDNCGFSCSFLTKEGDINKENTPFVPDSNEFKVRAIINTTNLFDRHRDVHLPGLWKKSLKENRGIMHVQEHMSNKFSHIISDGKDLNAFTKIFTWEELGATQFNGKTEALTFDSLVRKERNPFMFKQYANAWVKMHSVGMFYIKVVMGINDEDFGAEFEAWQKYSPEIANIKDAEEIGFAWFVKEAKVTEGSAVPVASNWITPTEDNNLKGQPLQDTDLDIEPSKSDTQKEFYLNYLKKTNGKKLD